MRRSKKETDPLKGSLTDLLDKKGWKRIQYEIKPKSKTITLRLSEELLIAVKEKAESEGLDYQKWIRLALEQNLSKVS
jgi:predicted DNA binding CopG/RHH family protein